MSSEIAEIIALMEFAAQRGLSQFVHDDGKTRIALTRTAASPLQVVALPPSFSPASSSSPEAPASPGLTAPMPGICHLSPDPASPPFVTEGSRVEAGQTLCVIEAMKLMTAIPAPHAGTVIKVHITSGSSVQTGDPLMEIRA